MLFSRILAIAAVSAVSVAALPSLVNGGRPISINPPLPPSAPKPDSEPVADAGLARRDVLAARGSHLHGINPPLDHLRHGTRDVPAVSPLEEATKKVRALKPQVAEIMAGPKEDREQKFIALSGTVLTILEECNQAVGSKLASFKLTDTATGDQMSALAKAVIRVLRSTKGLHNAQIATNAEKSADMLEEIEKSVKGIMPAIADSMPTSWSYNVGKVGMISTWVA